MRNSLLLASLLVALFAACSAPAITAPSPTALLQPSPILATRSPASATPPSAVSTQSVQLGQPDCFRALDPTPAMTEGPFYKENSPEKTSLIEPGMTGTRIILTGFVLMRDCKSVARAKVDVWQTDDRGEYDNVGYRMRGHVFSDADGRYSIETLLPGLYPGRTRHIHVKVIAPNLPTLTTQLFIPNEARNQSDSIFDRALLVTMQDTPKGKSAMFNFVLAAR